MARPKRKCTVEGCEGKHVGRGFCMKHYQQMRFHGKLQPLKPRNRVVSAEAPRDMSSYVMISECCRATVTEGDWHEYGKQYCDGCGEACLWRYVHRRDLDNSSTVSQ